MKKTLPHRRLRLLCLLFACLLLLTLAQGTHAQKQDSPSGTLQETLHAGLLAEREVISLAHLPAVTREEVSLCYSALYATDPALFFISSHYTLGLEGEHVVYLRPTYRYVGEARRQKQKLLARKVDEILAGCGSSLTDRETVTYLHDTVIARFSYDADKVNYDALSLVEEGTGVCQAYALLFKALCDRAGIPCECVPAFEENHEWNRVYLDGTWLHLDLTWNEADSTPTSVSHLYFLLPSHPAAAP